MDDQIQVEADHVTALRKRKVDGALYCRPPDIENLLGVLIRIDEADALARARIRSRRAPGWLPGECLVHMMRRAGQRGERRAYNQWCTLVLERVRGGLPRASDVSATARTLELAEYALDRFVGLLGPDLAGYEDRLDIWEARFDLALANLRRDAFRRDTVVDDQPVETVTIGDDEAVRLEVERALGAFNPFDPALEAEDDFRSRVWAAIDALPTEQNRIMTMMREGLPVGSGAAGENSISGILGKTPRTILNQKLRAFAVIREAIDGAEK